MKRKTPIAFTTEMKMKVGQAAKRHALYTKESMEIERDFNTKESR